MNIADLLILIIIAAAVFFAVRNLRRKKKSGCCSCGCSDCPARCTSRGARSKNE
ncbi:MAG: FeoB-associated Cys-rich membrane protein [Flexilinea sp.]|nr:FeoB-associated Cys-rich membrane protein [Flexilinea sp.]